MKRSSRLIALGVTLGLAIATTGCGDDNHGGQDLGAQRDLAVSTDLAMPGDLAGMDQAVPGDLAEGDQSAPPDLLPPTPSSEIAAVRAAADRQLPDGGTLSIDVQNVYVTYTGSDLTGFYVQAENTGPALFVGVDPATLTPPPVAGDQVSFTVTAAQRIKTLPTATAIENFSRSSQGFDVKTLSTDFSTAADLVTNIDKYDSRMTKLTGTLSGPLAASGASFDQAQIDTAAVTGNAALKARIALTIVTADDLAQGCVVQILNTPLGRFGSTTTTVQPSAYQASELMVTSCPAPQVVSATAASPASVVVTFDRNIDSASIDALGQQFTFDNGLTATAATATTARTITVTTSPQTGGTTYTVTVAGTSPIKDTRGTAIDPAHNTATFLGYVPPATLQINEVNPGIAMPAGFAGQDLVELRAVTAGSTGGIVLQQGLTSGPVTVATLPAINVNVGDLLVVHVNAPVTVTTETTSLTSCTDAACYAGAYDIAGGTLGSSGLAFSYRVLLLKSGLRAIEDGVAYRSGSAPGYFAADLKALQVAGQWLPADCGGVDCSTTSTPTIDMITVPLTGIGNTAAGLSLSRKANVDTNLAADWAVQASSFGATNP